MRPKGLQSNWACSPGAVSKRTKAGWGLGSNLLDVALDQHIGSAVALWLDLPEELHRGEIVLGELLPDLVLERIEERRHQGPFVLGQSFVTRIASDGLAIEAQCFGDMGLAPLRPAVL